MTKISKAFKFRIYPNKSQQRQIEDGFKLSNFIYNFFLAEQRDLDQLLCMYGLEIKKERIAYKKEHGLFFNLFEASKELTKMANTEQYSFIMNTDANVRTYTLRAMESAFKTLMSGRGGYPKFKNINKSRSFTGKIPYKKDKISVFSIKNTKGKWCKINIPKIRGIKANIHFEDLIKYYDDINLFKFNSYTISQNVAGQYFISLQAEVEKPEVKQKEVKPETSLGIDVGVERIITTSDDFDMSNPLFKKQNDEIIALEKERERLQRILSKKRLKNKNWKNSKKYKSLKNKISKIYVKITNKRNDLNHNITAELIKREDANTFVMEDVKIKEMVGNTKKKKKMTNRVKRKINKSLLSVSIYGLRNKLEYKAGWVGKNVVLVDPKFTSQQCNNCGHINKSNRQTQSKFQCKRCGHKDNADLNAAKNIKNKFFSEVL